MAPARRIRPGHRRGGTAIGPQAPGRGRAAAPGLGSVAGSPSVGAIDPVGAIVAGAPGAALVAGISCGATSTGAVSSGAGAAPGDAPKATIAIAATTTHAAAAASPSRPARRRGRDLAAGVCRSDALRRGGRGPGLMPRPRRRLQRVRIWLCRGMSSRLLPRRPPLDRRLVRPPPSRRSRYGSAAAPAPGPGLDPAPPITGSAMPAGAATTWREAGGSTRRKGAHLRHAASTRFQQSAQHAAPQLGQSRYVPCADVTVSRSRPQRSQNWVPRSTIHSTPAQSPGGCATRRR